MKVLLDTNIVLRYIEQDAKHHGEVVGAVDQLIKRGDNLIIVPQVLYEFWAVASRPAEVNGLGWLAADLQVAVIDLLEQFDFTEDSPGIFQTWLDLVTTHRVAGKPTHDARLAAAYLLHNLDALLTLNAPDFKRFGLNVLSPADVTETP